MDIRSFLKGYFYSCLIATNKKQNPDFGYTEIKLSSVILVTPSGTLEFRINRGISHIDGNLVLPAFEDYESLYDLHTGWNSPAVNNIIGEWLMDRSEEEDWEQCSEIRVTLNQLISIISACGGIDYTQTINHFSNLIGLDPLN